MAPKMYIPGAHDQGSADRNRMARKDDETPIEGDANRVAVDQTMDLTEEEKHAIEMLTMAPSNADKVLEKIASEYADSVASGIARQVYNSIYRIISFRRKNRDDGLSGEESNSDNEHTPERGTGYESYGKIMLNSIIHAHIAMFKRVKKSMAMIDSIAQDNAGHATLSSKASMLLSPTHQFFVGTFSYDDEPVDLESVREDLSASVNDAEEAYYAHFTNLIEALDKHVIDFLPKVATAANTVFPALVSFIRRHTPTDESFWMDHCLWKMNSTCETLFKQHSLKTEKVEKAILSWEKSKGTDCAWLLDMAVLKTTLAIIAIRDAIPTDA